MAGLIALSDMVLKGEAATARLANDCARAAKAGDLILLEGDLGAGKTAFARAFLRSLADDDALEVPSPTYTLVQAYPGTSPALHADLYRIADATEIDELGLDEGREQGIVLVEWPERAPSLFDRATLVVSLSGTGATRRAIVKANPEAAARYGRSLAIRAFLAAHGSAEALRRPLAGDASTRAYETVQTKMGHRVLMNAPRMPDGPPIRDGLPYSRLAHLAESVTPFVAIARLLSGAGFAAPAIHAQDLDAGLLLISDLGRDGVLDGDGRPVAERYVESARLLAVLHGRVWPHEAEAAPGVIHAIPAYSRRALLIETELFIDWYWAEKRGTAPSAAQRTAWVDGWNGILDAIGDGEQSLVLRDFHSPNIIWRDARHGTDRVGLIDFQDAVIGPSAYDVASLARDARVTIDPALEQDVRDAYCAIRAASGAFDQVRFARDFAVMAAQRNAKILGIFIRLNRRDGKPTYLKHLPRVEAYFARSLREPVMQPIAALLAEAGFEFTGWNP
jgi:N-acetylmuramate 1-kinase